MDLDLSEEQEMLQQMVAKLCQQYCDSQAVRAAEQSEDGCVAPLWDKLVELGLTGLAAAEEHEGADGSLLDIALVYEMFGRALAATPHWVSCVLAVRLLEEAAAAVGEQAAELLPLLARGERVATVAWREPDADDGLANLSMRASEQADQWYLQGDKTLVPFASLADHFLILARYGEEPAATGLYLVDRRSVGLTLLHQRNHANEALFALQCRATPARCLWRGEEFAAGWQRAQAFAMVPLAAQAVGGASAILEMSTEYAKERKAFGQPIGAFQSIAHYLADMATEVESARVLAWQAAWAFDQGLDLELLPLMAKRHAGAVFRRAAVTGVQIHGGMGFSLEADPQLYYRRAKQWQLLNGDPLALDAQIADRVLSAAREQAEGVLV